MKSIVYQLSRREMVKRFREKAALCTRETVYECMAYGLKSSKIELEDEELENEILSQLKTDYNFYKTCNWNYNELVDIASNLYLFILDEHGYLESDDVHDIILFFIKKQHNLCKEYELMLKEFIHNLITGA